MSNSQVERPILFNGEMVRKILNGDKTQTRRIIKKFTSSTSAADCPFGKPGDLLWVRETFSRQEHPAGYPQDSQYLYRATQDDAGISWKPSIHMPRHAARIFLEITSIKLEYLNAINREDSSAEGCGSHADPIAAFQQLWCDVYGVQSWQENPMVWVVEFKIAYS